MTEVLPASPSFSGASEERKGAFGGQDHQCFASLSARTGCVGPEALQALAASECRAGC